MAEQVEGYASRKIWLDSRNKVIALREKLREGEEAVKKFQTAYRIDGLPPIKDSNTVNLTLEKSGWTEKHCGYFDSIEAMEFYFPLNKGE